MVENAPDARRRGHRRPGLAELAGQAPAASARCAAPACSGRSSWSPTCTPANRWRRYGGSSPAMNAVIAACKAGGLLPFANFNRIHVVPPCNVTADEVREGLAILTPRWMRPTPRLKSRSAAGRQIRSRAPLRDRRGPPSSSTHQARCRDTTRRSYRRRTVPSDTVNEVRPSQPMPRPGLDGRRPEHLPPEKCTASCWRSPATGRGHRGGTPPERRPLLNSACAFSCSDSEGEVVHMPRSRPYRGYLAMARAGLPGRASWTADRDGDGPITGTRDQHQAGRRQTGVRYTTPVG